MEDSFIKRNNLKFKNDSSPKEGPLHCWVWTASDHHFKGTNPLPKTVITRE